jgi:hypothetical protein
LQLGRTLARSNENVKNIGEERRTQGGRRRADGPSGLAGPRAQATDREDAWQEPPLHPSQPPTEKTTRTEEASDTRARTRPSAQQSERTGQHDRQHGRADDRPNSQPGDGQRNPTRDQTWPRSGCVHHSSQALAGIPRLPFKRVACLALARGSQHTTAGGRGQGHAPGGRDMRGHAWACSCPCPCPCLEPCARAFERGETGSSRRPPGPVEARDSTPATPWLSLVSRADIRNPVPSNPPFRSGCRKV